LISISEKNKPSVQMLEVGTDQLGQRLDNYLFKLLKQVPRTRIYRIIRKGEVRVNKKRIKPDYKLRMGDLIRVPPVYNETPDEPVISDKWLKLIESAILFENQHLIVIDKPAGVAVHSGSGVPFGVIDIIRLLRPDSEMELVHRLDRDTSGCLLLARHRQSLLSLQQTIKKGSLVKIYTAVVKGVWNKECRDITHRLKKMQMSNGERRVYVDAEGQQAHTRILEHSSNGQCSRLSIQLLSGRTHQIRVHCQAEGHEIVGDNKYGDRQFNQQMKKQGLKRLMLHASRLEVPASEFHHDLIINAPLPDSFYLID
jgi:23S rRNA pseudouridine955/2504/2580 synthase